MSSSSPLSSADPSAGFLFFFLFFLFLLLSSTSRIGLLYQIFSNNPLDVRRYYTFYRFVTSVLQVSTVGRFAAVLFLHLVIVAVLQPSTSTWSTLVAVAVMANQTARWSSCLIDLARGTCDSCGGGRPGDAARQLREAAGRCACQVEAVEAMEVTV